MGFKTIQTYNEEKFGGLFLLRNDGDYADVIFLYEKPEDVLVADVHYIKSDEYSGYVHCCGRGCPACGKNIRIQTKLFIPLYNVTTREIQFWDRTIRFEPQLQQDVFSKYSNPSEFVFRITRHGKAGSVDTTYEIQAISKNSVKSFGSILAENNVKFPDHYSQVCRDLSFAELETLLSTGTYSSANNMPAYQASPRVDVGSLSNIPDIPESIPDTDESLQLSFTDADTPPFDVADMEEPAF